MLGIGGSMMMSTSGLFLDQTIEKSAIRPKKDKTVESTSEVDFGNSRSVSPIQEKLNKTLLPAKKAFELINNAPPAPGLQIKQMESVPASKVDVNPLTVVSSDSPIKVPTEVKKTEMKQTEVK